jgi:hypothetical protein
MVLSSQSCYSPLPRQRLEVPGSQGVYRSLHVLNLTATRANQCLPYPRTLTVLPKLTIWKNPLHSQSMVSYSFLGNNCSVPYRDYHNFGSSPEYSDSKSKNMRYGQGRSELSWLNRKACLVQSGCPDPAVQFN